jgi:hypothetical protein
MIDEVSGESKEIGHTDSIMLNQLTSTQTRNWFEISSKNDKTNTSTGTANGMRVWLEIELREPEHMSRGGVDGGTQNSNSTAGDPRNKSVSESESRYIHDANRPASDTNKTDMDRGDRLNSASLDHAGMTMIENAKVAHEQGKAVIVGELMDVTLGVQYADYVARGHVDRYVCACVCIYGVLIDVTLGVLYAEYVAHGDADICMCVCVCGACMYVYRVCLLL